MAFKLRNRGPPRPAIFKKICEFRSCVLSAGTGALGPARDSAARSRLGCSAYHFLCAGSSGHEQLIQISLAALILAVGFAGSVAAGQFEDGIAAYERGDYAAALQLFRPLAEHGDTGAQFNIGLMYDKGIGVPQDYMEAAKWYSVAALGGLPKAQHNLGLMYLLGHGRSQDSAVGIRWIRLAAERGNVASEFWLGVIYRSGREIYGPTVPYDPGEALKWFRMAASNGNVNAQSTLGFMYREGEGVPQDYVQAHMWLNLAAAASTANKQNLVAEARDNLAAKMTPAQIAEAQRLAREWKPK